MEMSVYHLCFLAPRTTSIMAWQSTGHEGSHVEADCLTSLATCRSAPGFLPYRDSKIRIRSVGDKASVRTTRSIHLLANFCIVIYYYIIALTISYQNDPFIWLMALLVSELLKGMH